MEIGDGGYEVEMGFSWEVGEEFMMSIGARICSLVNSTSLVDRVFKSGILTYQCCPSSEA